MGDILKKVEALLAGKKTYIGAAILAVAVFLVNIGKIDQHTYDTIQGAIIAWGFASVRAAIK